MADRCIDPLSTYYAGCGMPRKNRFCDTHPLRSKYILFNIILIIGQITTSSIHSLSEWAITLYTRLTHSPLSGGLAIQGQIVQIRAIFMRVLLNRLRPYAWGVCCCYLETGRTKPTCIAILYQCNIYLTLLHHLHHHLHHHEHPNR